MIAAVQVGVDPVIVFRGPYCTVHVQISDARDHLGWRASNLALCLTHIPVADFPAPFVALLRKMADDLREVLDMPDEAAILADQLVELLYMGSEPSYALWNLQQLADEIKETLAGMILSEASA